MKKTQPGGKRRLKAKNGLDLKRNQKQKKLEIHEDKIFQPEYIPEGSRFKGYRDFIVQDLVIGNWNIRCRRAGYETPDGGYVTGKIPAHISQSHFGSTLTAFILYQYYHSHVTQPLIPEQLKEYGIDISSGMINRIITENKEQYHEEKEKILSAGLKFSGHINVDDTGARHNGENGYCTYTGNEFFAWFKSTESKGRFSFLQLLQGRQNDKGCPAIS